MRRMRDDADDRVRQPADCLWPVAGVIDDDSLPKDMESALCRSIHICCSMMQPWYKIPDDDLPRLKYAG